MAKKSPRLFTIGYEKATPQAVLGELTAAKVELLVDVRAVAASRKPGFSKRQLAAGLDEAGIAYQHFQKLGTPTEGRLAARSGDMDTLFKVYSKHLKTPEAREEMDALANLVTSGKRVCILCFERDVHECHRQWIAEEIEKRTGAKVEDLVTPPILPVGLK
jgi:uncharacterized protein (DUF488 family)